jgi:hypothetical protein
MSTQPDQTYLARTFEDGRYAWTRTRSVRRRVVVAEAALLTTLLVATLVAAVTAAGPTVAYLVTWTLGMVAFVPLHSCLNLGIRGLFDRSGRSLDEHQQRLREQSAGAVVLPSQGMHLLSWAGGIALLGLTGQIVLALCLAFLLWLAAWLLSYWYLGWTLPDEDAATDVEG